MDLEITRSMSSSCTSGPEDPKWCARLNNSNRLNSNHLTEQTQTPDGIFGPRHTPRTAPNRAGGHLERVTRRFGWRLRRRVNICTVANVSLLFLTPHPGARSRTRERPAVQRATWRGHTGGLRHGASRTTPYREAIRSGVDGIVRRRPGADVAAGAGRRSRPDRTAGTGARAGDRVGTH